MANNLVNGERLQYFLNKLDSRYSTIGHTHNYAGSDTPGGKANMTKGSLNIFLNGQPLDVYRGDIDLTVSIRPETVGAVPVFWDTDSKHQMLFRGKTVNDLRTFLQNYISTLEIGFHMITISLSDGWYTYWNTVSGRETVLDTNPDDWTFNIWVYYSTCAYILAVSYVRYQKLIIISLYGNMWTNAYQATLTTA